MDWKYGRISEAEAVGGAAIDAAIEGATTVAGGAALKVAGKGIAETYKFGTSKFSELLSKSKSVWMARFGENLSSVYSANRTQLNWNIVKHGKGKESVLEHIMTEHKTVINPRKDIQSIFYENPKQIIEAAWAKKNRLNIEAVNFPGSTADYYIVPWENAGYMNFGTCSEFKGGLLPRIECDHVIIMTQKGTNNIINGFPSSKTVNRDIFGHNILKGKRK